MNLLRVVMTLLNDSYLTTICHLICVEKANLTAEPKYPLNCFKHDEIASSWAFQAFVAVSFVLLIFASVIGNAVVMWIIFKHKVMHHAFNYFLFNMALADMLIAVINVGTSWTYNLYYDWWYGSFCSVNLFFGIAPTCVSVFSMTALSLDRYQAVVNPLGRRVLSAKSSAIGISIFWIASSLMALPAALYAQVDTELYYVEETNHVSVKSVCAMMLPELKTIAHWIPDNLYDHCLFVVQYALPLLALTFTFTRIAHAFWRSDQIVIRQSSHKSDPQKAKRKVVKMLAVMVAVFMICWFPYHVYHSFAEFFEVEQTTSRYIAIYWLAMCTSACNPFIYCFTNKRFRVGFRFAFRRMPFVKCDRREYENSALFSKTGRTLAFQTERGYSRGSRLMTSPGSGRHVQTAHYSSIKQPASSPISQCSVGNGHSSVETTSILASSPKGSQTQITTKVFQQL